MNYGNSSVAQNVLGYPNGDIEYNIGPAFAPTPAWDFAHTDSSLTVGIESNWLEPLANESWAIGNVVVRLK